MFWKVSRVSPHCTRRSGMNPSFRRGWRNDHKLLCSPKTCTPLSWRWRGGGGGEGFTRFYTGRLHPERRPPPYPIVYHFGGKDTLRLSYIVQVNEQYYGRTSSMSRRDVNQKVYFIQLRLWQEWRWQISLPFHILRLVNSLPLYIAEASPYSPWLDGVALPLAPNREVYPLCDIM